MKVIIADTDEQDLLIAARAAKAYLSQYPDSEKGHITGYSYGDEFEASIIKNKDSITVYTYNRASKYES